jgi:hypothetical protein
MSFLELMLPPVQSSSQLQLEERIIAEQQKNLQLKHELDLTANFDKQSASVSAVRSSLKVGWDRLWCGSRWKEGVGSCYSVHMQHHERVIMLAHT